MKKGDMILIGIVLCLAILGFGVMMTLDVALG